MDIIEQIRNILNKTVDNGASEAEAASAAATAQKLLAKHRLTMADLVEPAADGSEVGFDFGEHFKEEGVESGSRIAQWKITLFTAVCNANGCKSLCYQQTLTRGGRGTRGRKLHKMVVVGEEKDAILAQAFYINLRDTIEAMAKRCQPSGLARGEGKKWANSFKLGACHAIYNRLEAATAEAASEARDAGATTALVRLDNQEEALTTFMKQAYPNLATRQTSKVSVFSEAYSKGREKGRNISLESNLLG